MTIQKAVLLLLVMEAADNTETTPARAVQTTALPVQCPSGWVAFEPSCYYIDDDATKVWSDSRLKCQALGSDLAVIDTQAENEFIADLIQNHLVLPTRAAWIGLQLNRTSNAFRWIDGSPPRYNNWKSGEPNDAKGNEDCVFMLRAGTWNDDPCNLNGYSFWNTRDVLTLCERPFWS